MSEVTVTLFLSALFSAVIAAHSVDAAGQPTDSDRHLHINEVMSSNATSHYDEDGDAEDWIELYNSGSKPLPLNGYGLSDDYQNPYRWVFPDITIDPGEFLLIMASGKNRRDPDRPLHANFRIASEGEEVILTNYSGVRVDSLPPTRIPTDISLGRLPDGTGDWYFFLEPTPGAPNTGEAYRGKLEKPIFFPKPGCYDQGFQLSMYHPEEEVTIHYTLDGSEPGPHSEVFSDQWLDIQDRSNEPNILSEIPTSSSLYWMPPKNPVKKATVVRAVVVKPGYIDSRVQTGTFLVDTDCSERYSLPVVSLVTDRGHFFDENTGIYVHGESSQANFWQTGPDWERPVHIELFDEDGKRAFKQDAGIRIHGGATRLYGQKSLRLYARNEYGDSRFRFRIFPDEPSKEFNRLILRNSGNDWQNTMFRDAFAQSLVRHLNMDTQAYRPAVVFLNGEYWGIHNFRERYDRHYLNRVYGVDPDRIDLLTLNMQVKEGDNEHYQYLVDFLTENDMGDASHLGKAAEMIDMHNFLDYYSSQIYFANRDWPQNNIDFWRLRVPYDSAAVQGHDGRWRWLMYDVDYAFGLANDHNFDMLDWVMKDHWSTALFWNLIDSDDFRNRFINRMADHLNTAFHPSRVLTVLDSLAVRVEPEIPEHFDRWGQPGSWAGTDWTENVNQMRDFARHRPESVREHLMSHFQLDGLAELTVDVSDPSAGYVVVNDIKVDRSTPGIDPCIPIDSLMPDVTPAAQGTQSTCYPWSGVYFRQVPLTVRAVAHPEYHFSHWDGLEGDYPDVDDFARTITLPLDRSASITAVFKMDTQVTEDSDRQRSNEFALHQNYPNPFNHSTIIRYQVPEAGEVKLEVFDVIGRRVAVLVNGALGEGRQEVVFDAPGMSSGIYIYRLEAGGKTATRSMVQIR